MPRSLLTSKTELYIKKKKKTQKKNNIKKRKETKQ